MGNKSNPFFGTSWQNAILFKLTRIQLVDNIIRKAWAKKPAGRRVLGRLRHKDHKIMIVVITNRCKVIYRKIKKGWRVDY